MKINQFIKGIGILFTLFLIIASSSFPQTIFKTPLSPRNASYDLDVHLNTDTKIIDGFEVLHWKNLSKNNIKELRFHLYLNAFKNTNSTFMIESGGQLRGDKINKEADSSWGWIDVISMKVKNGGDLTDKIKFIHPDDDNAEDRTVISVPLERPVKPGQTIDLDIKFRSKLPQIFARTGYAGNYFLVGQWFPKIGVYEYPGIRYAKKGGWNCHQFHANSEFYADFGVYNVSITLPKEFIVGAVGLQTGEKENKDGTKTVKFHAEDVVDFAWTASPIFKIAEKQWKDVKIKVFLQPEHFAQADRHINSAINGLEYFEKYLGKYPYPNLTIVDPPIYAMGSGGMEYPTFITAGCLWGAPNGIKLTEMVVIHEFGHNYFMGLLATNEFEEAWMDEGFNSYYETRIMDHYYGRKTSFLSFAGYHFGDLEMQRQSYVDMTNPKIAPGFLPAWGYKNGGYGSITYGKTATWMATLDRLVGRKVMDEIMKTYYARWHFKHPCATNFIDVVNEIVKKRLDDKFGTNMNWFFDQVLYGTNVCDYKLAGISVNKIQKPAGVYDSSGVKIIYNDNNNLEDSSDYKSRVSVYRLGEVTMPVEILIHFNNGKDSLLTWDGKARTFNAEFEGKQKVEWAKVDPDEKLLIDVNFINNSYTTKPETTIFRKYTTKFIFWVENLMTSFSMIF